MQSFFRKLTALLLIAQLPLGTFASAYSFADPDRTPDSETAESLRNVLHLDHTLSSNEVNTPEDTFRVLDQEVLPFRNPLRIRWNRLSLRLMLGSAVLGSADPGNDRGLDVATPADRIEIAYQGESFHRIHVESARSALFFGDYLVFVEEGAFLPSDGVQNLSFIDLRSFSDALGRVEFPVFRIPVKTGGKITQLSIENGQLKMTGPSAQEISVPEKLIDVFANIQRMVFSGTVALVDPETYESAGPLVTDFYTAFDQSLELAGKDARAQVEGLLGSRELLQQYGAAQKKILENNTLEQDPRFQQTLLRYKGNVAAQRRLTFRLNKLVAALTFPQPRGAPKIKAALIAVASGLGQNPEAGALRFLNHPYIRRGAPVVVLAAIGAHYPQETLHFLHESLDIARTALEMGLGKAKDLVTLTERAGHATFGFVIDPSIVTKAYLTPEKLPHFLIGLTAIISTIYVSLGVPHLLVNSVRLAIDLKDTDWSRYTTENLKGLAVLRDRWRAFKQAFIDRQNLQREGAIQALSKAEFSAQGKSVEAFTEAQGQEVEKIIRDLESRQEKGRWDYTFGLQESLPILKRFEKNKAEGQAQKIETFAQALREFIFSFSSFTNSSVFYAQLWNVIFSVRSFAFTPSVLLTYLAYPNFIPTSVSIAGKPTLPTSLNGGTASALDLLRKSLFDRDRLAKQREWETRFVEVETTIHEEALKKSFQALIRFLDNQEDLQKLFESGGIRSLNSEVLGRLAEKPRRFFQSYFLELFNEASRQALVKMSGMGMEDTRARNDTAEALKENLLQAYDGGESNAIFTATAQEARGWVERAATSEAYRRAAGSVAKNPQLEILRKINPEKNASVQFISVVNRQIKNPKAVARATRSMMTSLWVDTPVDLIVRFLLLAGVTQGVMAPLQNEMFGPNSWFYLSRMGFESGLVYAAIHTVLCLTWSKIQQDDTHTEAQLNYVPSREEAGKSFFTYYWKRTFKNPDNTLWRNQKRFVRLVFANMRSAWVMAFASQTLLLGRLDLDALLIGYLFSCIVPNGGLGYMEEQGFELSTGFFAADIPEELRAHPLAQQYIHDKISKTRGVYRVGIKVWETLVGYFLGNLETIPTPELGSRAMARFLDDGYTPTEQIQGAANWAKDTLHSVPGAAMAIDSCTALLTHNYTDFEKIKPGSGPPP